MPAPSALALQLLPDPAVVLDRAGRVTMANAPAEQAFGLTGTRTPALAASLPRSAAEPLGELLRGAVDTIVVDGPDGRSWSLRCTAVEPPGQALVVGRDVSALRSDRDRLRELADSNLRLRRLAEAIAQGAPADEVLARIARDVAELLGADLCALDEFCDGGFRVVAAHGPASWLRVDREVRPIVANSALGTVRGRGTALALADLQRESMAGRLSAAGARGFVAVPVQVSGRPWGALVVASSERWDDAPERARRAERFASILALAIGSTQARDELARRATTDSLTGALNAGAFRDHLEELNATGRPHCLMAVDVDHFKLINDRFGHPAGDAVLKEVVEALRRHCADGDAVGRVGGDELQVSCVDCPPDRAVRRFEAIRRALPTVGSPGGQTAVSVSAGIGAWQPGLAVDGLIADADRALYEAKAHARGWAVTAADLRPEARSPTAAGR